MLKSDAPTISIAGILSLITVAFLVFGVVIALAFSPTTGSKLISLLGVAAGFAAGIAGTLTVTTAKEEENDTP